MSDDSSNKPPGKPTPLPVEGSEALDQGPSDPTESGVSKSAKPGQKGFPKGCSGNPVGRPRGARNRVTLIAEQLLDGEAEEITRKAIELAKDGNLVALRLCLERILPPRRSRAIRLELSPLETPSDLPAVHDQILSAVTEGLITVDEAQAISSLLEAKRRAIETADLAKRLELIEIKLGIDP